MNTLKTLWYLLRLAVFAVSAAAYLASGALGVLAGAISFLAFACTALGVLILVTGQLPLSDPDLQAALVLGIPIGFLARYTRRHMVITRPRLPPIPTYTARPPKPPRPPRQEVPQRAPTPRRQETLVRPVLHGRTSSPAASPMLRRWLERG